MPVSILKDHVYSVSKNGKILTEQDAMTAVGGDVLVDLVTQPIEPGEYQMQLNAGGGDIKIFLPRYVHFTLNGKVLFGEKEVESGPKVWDEMQETFLGVIALPREIPDFALASFESRPVNIHFQANVIGGDIEIYRL